MNLNDFLTKKILLLGFGTEGRDTLRFFQEKAPSISLDIADQNIASVPPEYSKDKNIRWHLGPDAFDHLEEYEIVIRSPGTPFFLPEIQKAQKAGVQITSATKIFLANVRGTVVGITGSKGKSTTASLLYDILKAAGKEAYLIGNIGTPVLQYLENDHEGKIYIYELSSYQLEDLDHAPDIALVTSFFPAHLDHHETLEKYFQAKMNIVRNMKKESIFICHAGASKVLESAKNSSCRKILFDDDKESTVRDSWLIHGGEKILPVDRIPLLGRHNFGNVLGAIAAAKVFDIPNDVIQKAIIAFQPLEHRLEFVGEFQGIRFYNDSISTTPDSTIAAIEAFPEQIGTLILGGIDRGLDFTKLGEKIAAAGIPILILFPEAGTKIFGAVQKAGVKNGSALAKAVDVRDMTTCVGQAFGLTPKGRVCLLSPACQSMNLFANYQERGKLFKEEVKNHAFQELHNP